MAFLEYHSRIGSGLTWRPRERYWFSYLLSPPRYHQRIVIQGPCNFLAKRITSFLYKQFKENTSTAKRGCHTACRGSLCGLTTVLQSCQACPHLPAWALASWLGPSCLGCGLDVSIPQKPLDHPCLKQVPTTLRSHFHFLHSTLFGNDIILCHMYIHSVPVSRTVRGRKCCIDD